MAMRLIIAVIAAVVCAALFLFGYYEGYPRPQSTPIVTQVTPCILDQKDDC